MTAQTILPANSVTGGYDVDNSLRGTRGDSNYLSRTFETGNRDQWTWSAWVKKCSNGNVIALFSSYPDSDNQSTFTFTDDDTLHYKDKVSGSTQAQLITNKVFRDNSAWYHIVLTYDSGNGTAGNRIRLYINGVEETSFATDTMPGQNDDSIINSNEVHYLGTDDTSSYYLDCYLAEVRFVDGSALDPTSFGEFDSDSGIWKPKNVSGLTNGTNGFYLEFKQSGTSQNSSGLGADTSGEDHHFAVTNFAATDQSTDTCTNNFATLNPLDQSNSSGEGDVTSGVFTNGNLDFAAGGTIGGSARYYMSTATIAIPPSGKWYWEAKILTGGGSGNSNTGFRWTMGFLASNHDWSGSSFKEWTEAQGHRGSYTADGKVYYNNSQIGSTFATASVGEIVSFKYDSDNRDLFVAVDGTYINSGSAVLTDSNIAATDFLLIMLSHQISTSVNFGSPSFAISSGNADGNGFGNFEYAVPSGYFALCTKNLAEYG